MCFCHTPKFTGGLLSPSHITCYCKLKVFKFFTIAWSSPSRLSSILGFITSISTPATVVLDGCDIGENFLCLRANTCCLKLTMTHLRLTSQPAPSFPPLQDWKGPILCGFVCTDRELPLL